MRLPIEKKIPSRRSSSAIVVGCQGRGFLWTGALRYHSAAASLFAKTTISSAVNVKKHRNSCRRLSIGIAASKLARGTRNVGSKTGVECFSSGMASGGKTSVGIKLRTFIADEATFLETVASQISFSVNGLSSSTLNGRLEGMEKYLCRSESRVVDAFFLFWYAKLSTA